MITKVRCSERRKVKAAVASERRSCHRRKSEPVAATAVRRILKDSELTLQEITALTLFLGFVTKKF